MKSREMSLLVRLVWRRSSKAVPSIGVSNYGGVVFSGTLQFHCKFRCTQDVVCRVSVTRVYCDKTAKFRIIWFSLKCSPMPQLFVCEVWWRISKGFLLIEGSNWGMVMVFDKLLDAISRKRCEIGHNWSLIGSHIWVFDCNEVDDLEWPWTSIYCSVVSVMLVPSLSHIATSYPVERCPLHKPSSTAAAAAAAAI